MVTFAYLLVALTVVGGAILAYRQFRPTSSTDECYSYCRCPACEQKIRFLSGKAGRPAQCPRCLECWTLPATPGGDGPPPRTGAERAGQVRMRLTRRSTPSR
jgi:hypothetical protein